MARMIDADEVDYENISCSQSQLHWLHRIIEMQPTVDAVKVVHGYTIPAEEPKKVFLDRKCGICDQLMLSTDVFCPMCGARMDGDMENYRTAEVIR